MLAQNFKTPADLKIDDAEFDALRKVLGMLERAELLPLDTGVKGDVFCMSATYSNEHSCGTIGCIGGYAAVAMGLTGHSIKGHVYKYEKGGALSELYFPRGTGAGRLLAGLRNVTPSQGAIALRNYLTHGEPRWAEALAG